MPSGERRSSPGTWTTLVVVLLVGVVSLAGAARGAATTASDAAPDGLHEAQRVAMGTVFRIFAYAPELPADAVRTAMDEALREVTRLDRVLSHYDPDSELSRLVRTPVGEVTQVSAALHAALEQSLAMTRLTQGRFDVTVGPLVEVWRDAADRANEPDAEALAQAARCVGSERLTLVPPRGVRLASSCMRLDMGAIGKGIAVDRAMDVLRAHGLTHASVNAGGSTILAMGHAPGQAGWPVQAVGLDAPLLLQNEALSTSEATMEVIAIEPARPAATRMTVSVRVEDAATADALSTALVLSTVDQGREMLRQIDGASAWWAGPDGNVVAIAGPLPAGSRAYSGATR